MSMHDPITEMRLRAAEEQARQIRDLAQADAKARAERKAAWAKEKEERTQIREAEIEASLKDDKRLARARWLADHPDHDAYTFEHKAWPQLKKIILAEQEEALKAAEMTRLRRRHGL